MSDSVAPSKRTGGDEKGHKVERWFSLPSRPVFAFAGLWRSTEMGPQAFAVLTCEPNPLVALIHPKAMPVILDEADHDRWLSAHSTWLCLTRRS